MSIAKLKLSFSQLSLMKWMAEKPGRFMAGFPSSGSRHGRHFFFYEATSTATDEGKLQPQQVYPTKDKDKDIAFLKMIGFRESVDTNALYRAGLTTTHGNLQRSPYSAMYFSKIKQPRLSAGEVIILPTKNFSLYWEAHGREDYEKELAKIEKTTAEVSRTLVVGQKTFFKPKIPSELKERWPKGMEMPLPRIAKMRPLFTATVVRETATRLYLSDTSDADPLTYFEVLRGSAPMQYVEKRHVLADYAAEEMIERLFEHDREFEADIQRISVEAIENMLPLVENIHSRFAQKEAEYDDTTSDIIEASNSGASPKP